MRDHVRIVSLFLVIVGITVCTESAEARFFRHRRFCQVVYLLGENTLTPEKAREALLVMMQSKEGRDLGWFGPEIVKEMAKMPIGKDDNGWYSWTGAFRFNPSKSIYTLTIRPRPDVKACIFEYYGTYKNKRGRWEATAPKLVRTALQSGK
jgi:hypothetical protein